MGEVFTTDKQQATVVLVINGSSKGTVAITDPNMTIGAFVRQQAQQAGIRTFSVYLNGSKLDTEQAGDPIDDGSSIEIVVKDARG